MDFIPLNVRRSRTPSRPRAERINNRRSDMSAYAGVDARLRPRVFQYLETVQGAVHLNSMVDDLRKTYSEYSRKKRSSFKLSVLKIYNAHCRDEEAKNSRNSSEGNNSEVFLGESDFSVDGSLEFFEDKNGVNNSLRDLYSSTTPAKAISTPISTAMSARKTKRGARKSDTKPEQKEQLADQNIAVEVETVGPKKKSRRLDGGDKRRDAESNLDPKSKNKDREFLPQKSTVNFADVGGNEKCLEEVVKMLVHLKHPEVYIQLGVQPPRGLLLHGPPGCGKTLLAHAIAGELDVPFIRAAATEIVSGVSGESEERLRDLFARAVSSAPCILFIDEVDAITPKRETAQREMERRIVAQLLICMDDLNANDAAAQVLVIGATNRPDSLDPALRRAGRFDRELSMGIPDEAARTRILKVLCRKLRLQADVDYEYIAKNTPGYVGADLMALSREAAMCAVNRVFHVLQSQKRLAESVSDVIQKKITNIELALSWLRDEPPLNDQQLQDLFVEMRDFQDALAFVQPSAKREGFATVPDVTWDDVGALREVREELQLSILAPVRHPEKFKALGLSNPAGILLCGPPGCGKTMLAKAVANESGVNFISVKGPELLNMYVGESERAVRQCFQRARNSAPCVIFFDELDALCPKRSDSAEGSASSRVVNQLLTEMDGLDSRRDVYILGATNRVDIIDPAVMRPGRLDKVLYVGLPTADDRVDILKTITKSGTKPCLDVDLCLTEVGQDPRCSGFTGADLSALVREASVAALKDSINAAATSTTVDSDIRVGKRHFEEAFAKVRLSVSPKDQRMYDRMRREFTSSTANFQSSSEAKHTTPINQVQ